MNREMKQFNEYLSSWLDEVKIMHAPSTYVKYFHLVRNHIAPYFRGVALSEVTNTVLKEYREYLHSSEYCYKEKKLSDGTICCILMIVNAVMKAAYQEKMICESAYVSPGIKKRKKVVQVFSNNELAKLEHHIKRNKSLTNFGIYLCMYTGIRLGELCALKWENINTTDGYLHIVHTVQRLTLMENENRKSKLLVTLPKSETSARFVPIPSFLMPLVKEYAAKSTKDSFILTDSREVPMEPRTLQYQYKRCLEAAGIPYLNFHSLRHTFATRCITLGMDPKTLSEILGHSDIKITMDYYFHSSFEFKKNQIERLFSFA